MSRPDGYEQLPEGTEPFLSPTAPQPGPTITQPGILQQQQQPVSAGVTLGLPAFPPRAHQALGGSQLEQLPPFLQYLAELPSVADEWERAALLFSIWLGCSAATLALALMTLNMPAIMGSLCATIGAATHRFARFQKGLGVADAVNRILRLAIAAACLAGIVAASSTLIAIGLSAACTSADDKQICAEMAEITTLNGVWYSLFTTLTIAVARRAARMRQLLNPVSTGAVAL